MATKIHAVAFEINRLGNAAHLTIRFNHDWSHTSSHQFERSREACRASTDDQNLACAHATSSAELFPAENKVIFLIINTAINDTAIATDFDAASD